MVFMVYELYMHGSTHIYMMKYYLAPENNEVLYSCHCGKVSNT